MSNKTGGIFSIIFALSFSTLLANPQTERDSLLQLAESQFEYEQYPSAIAIYESLYEKGYFQEQMLYRLAYMHEQLGQFPQSIFYLRKLQWEVGGDHINEKVIQLMDKVSRERLSTGEGWTGYRLFLKRNQRLLIFLTGICILLSTVFLFIKKSSWSNSLATGLATLALLIAGLMIEQQIRIQPKAVVMQPTLFYELPAYAATPKSLPIGPGATVTIKAEQDIWCHISMGQFESWVPTSVIRKL